MTEPTYSAVLLSFVAGYVCGVSPSSAWLIRAASAQMERSSTRSLAYHAWTVLMACNVFAVGVGTVAVIAYARFNATIDGTTPIATTIGVFGGIACGAATFLFLLWRIDHKPKT